MRIPAADALTSLNAVEFLTFYTKLNQHMTYSISNVNAQGFLLKANYMF